MLIIFPVALPHFKYFYEINFLMYVVKYWKFLFVEVLYDFVDFVTFCFSGGGGG
jgi:hypothetical protein